MNSSLAALHHRRRKLVEEAAAQRSAIAHVYEQWAPRLRSVDRAFAIVRLVRSSPILMIVLSCMMLLWIRPRKLRQWVRIAPFLYRAYRLIARTK
jgi:YqjK-like protein